MPSDKTAKRPPRRDKITKRTLDAAEAGERDYFVWDTGFPGFGFKVTPKGRKVFVYQYRLPAPGEAAQTAPVRYTIGRYGAITPDQARKIAERLAGMVANGISPRDQDKERLESAKAAKVAAEAQRRLEGELAFSKYADAWLDHYEHERGRRPSSVRQATLVVRNYLKPALLDTPMPHIGRAELQPIFDGIPAKQKGMRRAVFAYASILFNWAVRRGAIAANPLAAMEKPSAPAARDRTLSDAEVKLVWLAAPKLSAPFDTFVRLLILTAQRRSEVAGMDWKELDRDSATWIIPAGRAKNKAAHIVPLSAAAFAEIDALALKALGGKWPDDGPAWPAKGLVLTTTGKTAISGISRIKAKLDSEMAKLAEGEAVAAWRFHDIRRTVATGFQQLGVRWEVTEAVLNHVSGSRSGVAGIYQQHEWKDEKRAALEAWAARVDAIVTDRKQDNVVSLDAAKRSA